LLNRPTLKESLNPPRFALEKSWRGSFTYNYTLDLVVSGKRNCEKTTPQKIDTSKTPRQLHTAVPEHAAQPASQWFLVVSIGKAEAFAAISPLPLAKSAGVACHRWAAAIMHRKQKPRQKPRLPVGVVAMDSQSAAFENICKTVFDFFFQN